MTVFIPREAQDSNPKLEGNTAEGEKGLTCCKDAKDSCRKGATEVIYCKRPAPAPPEQLFPKGDVIMFRIPNQHDYWNISMMLNGMTGQTFVSEAAVKAAK
jgi:hypothetical protein